MVKTHFKVENEIVHFLILEEFKDIKKGFTNILNRKKILEALPRDFL